MYFSDSTRILAGILLLSLVTVESGGLYLVRLVGGKAPATPFQLGFSRAGHAHAGVLLILSLVIQFYVDGSGLTGLAEWVARSFVPIAALLMPAGFFFSSMGAGRTQPNKLIGLVWAGAACLAIGLATLGIGLLVK
ncbi:MAG TPA: hypothetical protein VFC19_13710 [Candidatus Limnocylindrales bacterium]|nr:hypothetical protein [Candidatus Limnocylindrales bacterium]